MDPLWLEKKEKSQVPVQMATAGMLKLRSKEDPVLESGNVGALLTQREQNTHGNGLGSFGLTRGTDDDAGSYWIKCPRIADCNGVAPEIMLFP